MKKLIFTMDVEEWFHAENLRPYMNYDEISSKFSTLNYLNPVLDFLSSQDIKGTFFILAKIAEKNKSIVKKIHDLGHEIANHGLDHSLLGNLNKEKLEKDINDSTKILEDLIGSKVIGYRSPCFSQNENLSDALKKNDYKYTSMSIETSFHDRYKDNSYEPKNSLVDFPIPVARLGPLKVVCTGGGWFRLFPVSLQKTLLNISKEKNPIFYCHPWDFGDNMPKINSKIPFLKKFRHKVNSKKSLSKLEKLDFSKKPLKEYLTI